MMLLLNTRNKLGLKTPPGRLLLSVSSCGSCKFSPLELELSYLSGTGRSTGTYMYTSRYTIFSGGANLSRPCRIPSPCLSTLSEYAVYPESHPRSSGQYRSPGLQ